MIRTFVLTPTISEVTQVKRKVWRIYTYGHPRVVTAGPPWHRITYMPDGHMMETLW